MTMSIADINLPVVTDTAIAVTDDRYPAPADRIRPPRHVEKRPASFDPVSPAPAGATESEPVQALGKTLRGLQTVRSTPAQELRGARAIVHAAVMSCLPDHPILTVYGQIVHAAVSDFVYGRLRTLPVFLRVPYMTLLRIFDFLPLLTRGRRFVRLSPAPQRKQLETWSTSRLSPCRDCVKLIRNLTLMAFYEHPAVLNRLGVNRNHASKRPSDHVTPAQARSRERVPA